MGKIKHTQIDKIPASMVTGLPTSLPANGGHSDTTNKLLNARSINLVGAITGNASFDGSNNIDINTTVNHNHDNTYYTESEIDSKVSTINNSINSLKNGTTSVGRLTQHSVTINSDMNDLSIFQLGECITLYYSDGTNQTPLNTPYGILVSGYSTITWYNVFTFGVSTRVTQIASSAFSHNPGTFIRYKHDNTWTNWSILSKSGTAIGSEVFNDVGGNKATGQYSHAEGFYTNASANYSHAQGYGSQATGMNSHAEGFNTVASSSSAHAEGNYSKASGPFSHAQGYSTTASNNAAHAQGYGSIASGRYTTAEGYYTTAETYGLHVLGQYNKVNSGDATNYLASQNAFIIGNGSSSSAKSNAFRVTFDGKTYGLSAFNSSGADYAEYFEWEDGNPNNEDRIGLFVTLDGEKIKLADSENDYIIGIISGNQSIIGNASEDSWNDMYLRDDFDRLQYELVEVEKEEPIFNEETNEIEIKTIKVTEKHIKLNPNYNSEMEYIPRSERKEWGIVGMLGQIKVKDDGTCKVNGFCKPSENGIATSSDDPSHYRVIARINDNLIKVIMK